MSQELLETAEQTRAVGAVDEPEALTESQLLIQESLPILKASDDVIDQIRAKEPTWLSKGFNRLFSLFGACDSD